MLVVVSCWLLVLGNMLLLLLVVVLFCVGCWVGDVAGCWLIVVRCWFVVCSLLFVVAGCRFRVVQLLGVGCCMFVVC